MSALWNARSRGTLHSSARSLMRCKYDLMLHQCSNHWFKSIIVASLAIRRMHWSFGTRATSFRPL